MKGRVVLQDINHGSNYKLCGVDGVIVYRLDMILQFYRTRQQLVRFSFFCACACPVSVMVVWALRVAVFARISLTLLAVFSGHVVPPFDKSSFDVDSSVLRPLAHWDGAHFVGIALDGYNSDHSLAFFPLYPLMIRFCRYVLLVSVTKSGV
jgi:Gpi18-like mannosyltransferase